MYCQILFHICNGCILTCNLHFTYVCMYNWFFYLVISTFDIPLSIWLLRPCSEPRVDNNQPESTSADKDGQIEVERREQNSKETEVDPQSVSLQLDEDNSSIFRENEPRNEVGVDPDTLPPVSKKRKGKQRKAGSNTTSGVKVYTGLIIYYAHMFVCFSNW